MKYMELIRRQIYESDSKYLIGLYIECLDLGGAVRSFDALPTEREQLLAAALICYARSYEIPGYPDYESKVEEAIRMGDDTMHHIISRYPQLENKLPACGDCKFLSSTSQDEHKNQRKDLAKIDVKHQPTLIAMGRNLETTFDLHLYAKYMRLVQEMILELQEFLQPHLLN